MNKALLLAGVLVGLTMDVMSEETKWIWLPDSQPATTNVYAVFKTELPAGADTLRVAVSGTYAAKIDGEVVAFGQYTDFPQDKTYTERRLRPSDRPRTLTVETWFAGNRFSSHYDGEPGLWAEILSSNRVVSASSRAWQAAPMDAYEFGPRTILFISLNYTWAYDARKARKSPDWKPARELEHPMMSARPRLRPVEPSSVVRTAVGRRIGGGADYALYDFGEEVTGMLSFRLSAPRGREIEIVHGEFLRDGRLPDHAIVGNPGNPRRVVDTFVADGASQYTHWFRRYGLRYLEFRWQGDGVAVEPPEILVTELGGLETPPFRCSDPLFEQMHEISCRTLRCCLHEKYENCPWREQSICEYDARNQMLFGYPLWGNYDRAATMLRLFGAAEKEHGYLPAITPSMSGTTIPMFTFAWMGTVCDHAWYSGDDTLLKEQLPRIRRMLKKILARRKGDLYTIPESLPGAWVWNYCEPGELEFRTNPPNAFYNLYLHEALTDLAKALRRLGDTAGAADYERTAAALAKACEAYWDEKRGVYADSFASDGTREVFSGHVQALFLAQGLVPKARVPRVIAALREGKVKMPELSALRYLVKGVFDHGTDDDRRWMHGKIREIYGGMIAAGATTWWEATSGENYGTSGSLCHGWSALPSWYSAEYILGVRPTSPGYATYEVKPRIPGVTASGRVMTPKGPISTVMLLGDSPSENRATIQREIDAVSAAGGGRVTIPVGEWVTGSIELKSGVELHVPKGAVLRGSTSRTDYNPDDVFPENPSSAGEEWSGGHLIYAYKASDVAITGGGTIDGSGPAFFGECQYRGGWSDAWKYGLKLFPIDREWFRPGFMVAFFMCRNIRIQDVTLANTPCWTCHIRCSDGVSIRGVTIDADRTIANSDGFSIDCTRNVTVEKCIVKTGDDGFAIRASCSRHATTNLCENIVVRDCDVWSCCNAVRLGVGSGTIRKVSFEDCRFHESGTAVAFTPAWVAGKRNVYIEKTRFAHCYFGECRYPVVAFMPNADARVKDAVFEDCEMESMLPACINRTERAPVEGVRFVRCHRKTLFEGVKVRQDRRLLAEIKRQIRQEADLFGLFVHDCGCSFAA